MIVHKERNDEAARAILKGELLKNVAARNGFTSERARQLVHRFCMRANPDLYRELAKLNRKVEEYEGQNKASLIELRANSKSFLLEEQ